MAIFNSILSKNWLKFEWTLGTRTNNHTRDLYSVNWNIIVKMHQSVTLKTHMKKKIIPISRVEHRWQPTSGIPNKDDYFSRFSIKTLVKNDLLQKIFSRHRQIFWYKNSFSTNFLLMAASVYRNRLSDFDGLFYLHKLSNKNRYLQHFTTGLVGINLTTAQAATATLLKLIREVFCR